MVIIYFFKMRLINPIIIPPISTLIPTTWLELIGWFLSNSLIVWILSFTLKRGKIFVGRSKEIFGSLNFDHDDLLKWIVYRKEKMFNMGSCYWGRFFVFLICFGMLMYFKLWGMSSFHSWYFSKFLNGYDPLKWNISLCLELQCKSYWILNIFIIESSIIIINWNYMEIVSKPSWYLGKPSMNIEVHQAGFIIFRFVLQESWNFE